MMPAAPRTPAQVAFRRNEDLQSARRAIEARVRQCLDHTRQDPRQFRFCARCWAVVLTLLPRQESLE
jgi:hypothetical protein